MMLKQIRKFALQDRLQLSFIIVSILVQIVSWGFVFWRSHVDTEWRALGYNVSFGFVTDYGPTSSLYRIPALGLLVLVTNLVLAYMLYKRNEAYARVIVGVTAFLEIIVLIPLLAIYYLGNVQ